VNGINIYVPPEIWSSKELTIIEKLILGRIYYFTLKGNVRACLESNGKLAEVFLIHKDTVRRALRNLEKGDLICKVQRNYQRQLKLSPRCLSYFSSPSKDWD